MAVDIVVATSRCKPPVYNYVLVVQHFSAVATALIIDSIIQFSRHGLKRDIYVFKVCEINEHIVRTSMYNNN